jgi:hypothetical protein
MRRLGFSVGCALVALAVFVVPASADDTECVGVLGPVEGLDNVVVPRGQECTLVGADVKGNVKALRGSSLLAISNRIGGNVEGDRPQNIALLGSDADPSVVGGNVAITGVTGPGFPFEGPAGPLAVNVAVCDTILPGGNVSIEKSVGGTIAVGSPIPEICGGNELGKGNIFLQQNFIPAPELLFVTDNDVGGNLQVFKNRGDGAKSVSGNRVLENLQCKRNDQPFVGGPNVAGKAEGQCFAGP